MFQCGDGLVVGQIHSTSGCLVSFVDQPSIVLMLGACHGLVAAQAKPGDIVCASAAPGVQFGRLRTWTTFFRSVTADAALVWVDPAAISPDIGGVGTPSPSPNINPRAGDTVFMAPLKPGLPRRTMTITNPNIDIDLPISGPNWSLRSTIYLQHIACEPMQSHFGDSGAAVVDSQNRIVGIVIGGDAKAGSKGSTYVTPIASILHYAPFNGQLQILSSIPAGAVPPP